MLSSTIRLGKIAGIEVGINFTLLFVAVLVTSHLAQIELPLRAPGYSQSAYVAVGIVGAILFFASILLHELAHALLAQHYEIRVRRIVLYFLGGIAEIESEPKQAYQEFWIAIVGPLTNLVLGAIFWGMSHLFPNRALIGELFFWVGIINVLLAAFNIIPGFPLDGGRVLRAILWWWTGNYLRSTRWASYLGQGFAYLVLMSSVATLLLPGFLWSNALWSLFFGFFLLSAAKSQLQTALIRSGLSGIPIRDLVNPRMKVEADWPLAYAVDRIAMQGPLSASPVTQSGEWVGVLTIENVQVWPRQVWSKISVGRAMTPLAQFQTIDAENDLYETLQSDNFRQQPYLLVESDHELIGLLSHRDIVNFAERHLRQT